LFKLVLWPLVVVHDTCPPKILYFSFVTTEGKLIDYEHIYLGKMCGNMRRIRAVMEAEEWKWKPWRMAPTVCSYLFVYLKSPS
jgi:hypothetical protein